MLEEGQKGNMTGRKGIGTRCFATASTVAALLAGSVFGGVVWRGTA